MKNQNCNIVKLQRCCIKLLFVIFVTIAFTNKAECQKSDTLSITGQAGSYENTFSTSRIGLAQSVMTTPEGEFHIVVQHRFSDISGDVKQFFGLDFAVTRLGFEYGIFNWLSAGIGRSMTYRTYDLELKAGILKQKENIPLSLSWYSSVMENNSEAIFWVSNSFGSRLSFVNQLIMARNQGIFSFQVSPMWLHSNYNFTVSSSVRDIFALDLDSRIKLGEKLGIIVEYIPILTREDFTKTNPFTVGLDINTGGHQFQLIFSNSQGTNENIILTNTSGSWSKGHIYFGFNLTRVFHSR